MSNDQIIFEDKHEQLGFTQLPNAVLTSTVLNPTEVRIYGILRRYASMPQGAMPAVPTICLEANISKATYNRAIKKFIKSTDNQKPEIPLVTSIHRKNKSNLYKIHKITDLLIEKLKPAMLLTKNEQNHIKAKYKSKRKSTSQIDTPIENTGMSQIDTHIKNESTSQNETPVRLKMRPPYVSNCDVSNIELKNIEFSNIEQQQEKTENKKEVVVSLDQSFLILDKWETLFDESLSVKKISTLSKLAVEGMKAKQIGIHNPSEKDVLDRITHVMENMKVHSFPFKTNAVKAISDALENGYTWTTEKKQAKPRKRVSAEKIPASLINQLEQGQKEVAATVIRNDDWQSKLEEWNKQKRSNQ